MFHEMYIRYRPTMTGIFNNIRNGLVKQVTDMWHRKQQYLLTRTEISIVNGGTNTQCLFYRLCETAAVTGYVSGCKFPIR